MNGEQIFWACFFGLAAIYLIWTIIFPPPSFVQQEDDDINDCCGNCCEHSED